MALRNDRDPLKGREDIQSILGKSHPYVLKENSTLKHIKHVWVEISVKFSGRNHVILMCR